MSDAAVAWLCKFNGAPDGWVPPRAWRYAAELPTESIARTAALRDFNLAYARSGSKADMTAQKSMSALPPKDGVIGRRLVDS